MEPQNTPDSQRSVKKERQRWRPHTSSPHRTATGIKTACARWPSGYDCMLPVQYAQVPPLVGEMIPCHAMQP